MIEAVDRVIGKALLNLLGGEDLHASLLAWGCVDKKKLCFDFRT